MSRSPLRAAASLPVTLFLIAALCLGPSPAAAQVSIGADFVNRYVFRGIDFGESFSVQPDLSYSNGPFTIGTWASYAIADGAGVNEHDIYASLSFSGPSGTSFSFGATDYYFPTPLSGNGEGTEYFFDSDAHIIEPNVSVTGPSSFPLTLYGAVNAYTGDLYDPDNSVYLQASVPFTVRDVDLGLTVGGVPMESGFYGTSDPGVINMSLSASKAIQVTDSFSIPVSASYILNPYAERTFLVFGVNLSP